MAFNPLGNIKEQAKEQTDKLGEQERDLDKLVFRVFTSEDGKKLLDHYIKHTVDKPSFIPLSKEWNTDAYGYYREGQNSIIREFQIRKKRATSYKG